MTNTKDCFRCDGVGKKDFGGKCDECGGSGVLIDEEAATDSLHAEIESTLLRNLAILVEDSGTPFLPVSAVEAMLKACAANLAQVFAGRVKP